MLTIGQHLIEIPECSKTYTDDNIGIVGQARLSIPVSVLGSVFIKTQHQVCVDNKSSFPNLDSSSK